MAGEAHKLVIWPRESIEVDGKTVYRYVLVGMICTDTPIEFPNDESVAIGATYDTSPFTDIVNGLKKYGAPYPLGDANSALLTVVNDLSQEDMKPFDQVIYIPELRGYLKRFYNDEIISVVRKEQALNFKQGDDLNNALSFVQQSYPQAHFEDSLWA